MTKSSRKSGLVADGRERIRAANTAQVEQEVRARHADAWSAAGFFKRIRLRWIIRREVDATLNRVAPPTALYVRGNQT